MLSQNGWSANNYSLMATYTVPGSSVKVTLRKGDVSVVLLYVLKQFNATVETLRQSDTGGYNPRSVVGHNVLSNHASGTAVDVRWRDHPLSARGTFSTPELKAIRKILDYCEGVVRWGGDYKNRKDEMHFEINATPARVAALAEKIRKGPRKEASPVVTRVQDLQRGSKGNAVKKLQTGMNRVFPAYANTPLSTDGVFGPATEGAVKEFQRRTGLKPDGVVGKKTRQLLARYGVKL